MSIIAWDGRSVAADRQAVTADMSIQVRKITRLPSGTVLAWTGNHERGLWLAEWWQRGASPNDWPKWQSDDDWTRLLVFPPVGSRWESPFHFERLPVAQPVLGRFAAWGSGRDFAIGAMQMGASASAAVQVANLHCVTCGMGVDVEEIGVYGDRPAPGH